MIMKVLICLFWLLICARIFGQQNIHFKDEFKKTLLAPPINEEELSFSNFTEDISKRTLFSRSFKTTKGDIKSEYSIKPICFEKNGRLEPIISTPKLEKDGSWSAIQQPIQTKLFMDGNLEITYPDHSKISVSTIGINEKSTQKNS